MITGSAGGIGLATARLFLAEGAAVALLDHEVQRLAVAVASLPSARPETVADIVCDIADEAMVEEALAQVKARFGRLDILINNAAVRTYHRLGEASAETWEPILRVNILGTSNCTKAALPLLRESGHGSIVNVSSAFALVGRSGMGQYDATKAAIVSMTKVLANEEARHGVRVNVVCPGSVLTPFTSERAAARGMSSAELEQTGYVHCPLDRWGKPEEIAFPILWLASDEASFVTGAILTVDGGLTAR